MAKQPSKKNCCSFCGRPNTLVGKLIAGPDGANICNECVATCQQILESVGGGTTNPPSPASKPASPDLNDDLDADTGSSGLSVVEEPDGEFKPIKLIPPSEIRAVLDEHVIGQNQAKKVLSVAVYNHYKRLNAKLHGYEVHPEFGDDLAQVDVEKSNILLLGPTGSGKTLLARTLARVLDVPFAIADATTVTEAGYVGEDVETIVLRLLQAADFNVKRAETGIIYIDEIDKLALKGDSPHVSRNLGQGVQHALLKIVEGTVCNVPPQGGRKHPEQQYIQVDTANILFICGGAFVGLDQLVGKRIGNKFLGFDMAAKDGEPLTAEQIMENLQPEDLFDFGLIPEFVGRLPIVSVLSELTQADLERVLVETRNSLTKQYRKLLSMEGVKLTFTPEGISAIAKKALVMKTGARGLRSILEHMMLDTMYELPQHPEAEEVVITAESVEGKAKPEIISK
ncbi:MAG: ATP-dependent Clp protease ATP-binding subunit ClpX [Puniceicoccales bacterium]|jgi:ATP-dependent Clp protease ATP-binding subunit ClpX|nr:ATP-dependent Clp protease ATP-binding subunit ClpX [Puniceicoccales bacterium]